MAGGKDVALRFYADETDLALGKALAIARADVVHPGHPRLPEVPRRTRDEDWLPIVGSKGLVVITRDDKIRRKPIEKDAWCSHGVRGFALTGKTSQSTWDSLRLLARRWDEIEEIIAGKPSGPWMYAVTGGMRQIALGC